MASKRSDTTMARYWRLKRLNICLNICLADQKSSTYRYWKRLGKIYKESRGKFFAQNYGFMFSDNMLPPCSVIQPKDRNGFWIPQCRFRIQGAGFRKMISVNGFLIFSLARFWIPMANIPDSTAKISWIPESGLCYMGRNTTISSTKTVGQTN